MGDAFPHLLAPGRIGPLELRNRILMAPMGDCLGNRDGTVSETQIAYYEARARGGAALLLVGSVSVSYPRGAFDARQTAASEDAFLPGLAELTGRVHAHGAAIAAQLVHNGQMALHDVALGQPMLVPSMPKRPRPDRLSAMVTEAELAAITSPYAQPGAALEYRVATEADLAWVVERFVDAVERCRRAGFDGVELHAGHGYLVDEFLTPSLNTRTDGWGGTVENRARLLCEILRAVRARVGDEYPVWIRINALEHHKPDGERFEDQLRVIELACAEGIDAVHVTAYASTDVATGPTDSYAPHVVGDLAEHAGAVRERVSVPVVTFGRFEPAEAEAVLAAGKADFVAMGRKLLADPELPNKLAAGRLDDIRPCIYQYRCIGNIFVRDVVHCVARAATGREDTLRLPPGAPPRRVLVIGGGPAGLEVARLLGRQGHAVTLREATTHLGGTLALAARADPLLDAYLGWLVRQVERSGVTLELGRRTTPAEVLAAGADDVVVATGATWRPPAVPGADLPHVLAVPALAAWLGQAAALGERIVVLGGGKPGLTLAALARRRGHEVTVLEPTPVLGAELGLPGRWRMVADVEASGVLLVVGASVRRITEAAVLADVAGEQREFAADAVIVAAGALPNRTLANELRAEGIALHEVGDCREVARLEGANLDAARVALAISSPRTPPSARAG